MLRVLFRRIVLPFGLITLPAIFFLLVLLELTFRFIIPASEPPLGYFDTQHKIYRHDPSRQTGQVTIGAMAQQRGRWRINNYGWNSPIDFVEEKTRQRIAIIGDSYIEALQVDVSKSYPALLGATLADSHDVYGFGISGAPLSQYLHMTRYVSDLFDPEIVIWNVIHNDFYESIESRNPTDPHWMRLRVRDDRIEEISPVINPDYIQFDWRKQLIRESALARYLRFNLRVRESLRRRTSVNKQHNANIDLELLEESRREVRVAVEYILQRLRMENRDRRLILVMDAPRMDIYAGRKSRRIQRLHEMMSRYCAELGLEFVDLTPDMTRDFAERQMVFNSELDAHWNEYGHQFVARKVASVLLGPASLQSEGDSSPGDAD